ncbi:MAG: Gmad2 immunoglobulin-like domain-containing protein [bacterium]|nr:Gmad2 immunoglobulin-like domain-containing protein [bacterium]
MPIHRKIYFWIIVVTFSGAAAWSGIYAWKNLRGIGPVIKGPPEDITKTINTTGMPLSMPPGFSIEIFAKDLPGARVMAFDGFGNMWVSQTKQGIVSLLEVQDGKVARQNAVLRNLKNPHGLAFDPQNEFALYIAEEDKISRLPTYSDGGPEKIIDLSEGGGHYTRTIGFGPEDGRLYVSIGSSCNVCHENDPRRATIYSMNSNGSDFKLHARGLRNSVFFDWSYIDGRMWATEMGRDSLGDDIPPDEINIIHDPSTNSGQAGNYGWPTCYGKNIHDTNFDKFDKNTYYEIPCREPTEIPSYIDLQAHSAPLGLAFIQEEGWPEEYWHDLFVAYHGSWNRSEPTGYKIVRVKLDAQGNYEGIEDFITGWLTDKGALGRPVDIITQSGGIMYVSDDHAGVIYKITYRSDWSVRNFQECADAGYLIMESYPRQCREPGGKTFSEEIGNELEKQNLIRIDSPRPNSIIKSPLTITGEARGTWYFEASFPVELLDENGNRIAIHYAQAQDEWMTEDFVPFESILNFSGPSAGSKGTLILHKDNPSGLPEHDDQLRIPVIFGPSTSSGQAKSCIITGCSSQVCAEEEVITTCEYREEYACYRTAKCERQTDGQCGWTETQELTSCLNAK